MPYNNLTEYGSKSLFYKFINIKYNGHTFNKKNNINQLLLSDDLYVVKIDCGIKGRFKKGLVKINVNQTDIKEFINNSNYNNFIIEPFINNVTIEPFIYKSNEYYLSIINNGINITINYSIEGGIELGKNTNINTITIPINKNLDKYDFHNLNIFYGDNYIKIFIENILSFYNHYHLCFLEINPFIIINKEIIILDIFCKVDSTSLYLPYMHDVLEYICEDTEIISDSEKKINELDERTGGSLKFKLLNPNGNIWLLVAGGGASVAYIDAICSLGYSNNIANYGEYSGNPPSELVYQYCCNIFDLINKSQSDEEYYLFIGGAIANFTLVDKTFEGIIKAINEYNNLFVTKKIKVLVRRGGPNYEIGLENIKKCCDAFNIYCEINGPSISLTHIVKNNLPNKNINSLNNEYDFNIDIKLIYKNYTNYLENTTKMAIFGGDYQNIAQRIIDFDILSNRIEPSIGFIIDPNSNGKNKMIQIYWKNNSIIMIPVFKEIPINNNEVKGIVNFASFRSAYSTSQSCLQNDNIKWIAIIAEGMPELFAKKLSLEFPDKLILGPSTIGGIIGGNLRIGNTGGTIDNILSSGLHNSGSVGIITRSGGLLNELCNIVNNSFDGVHTALSIGGDRFPCTNFIDIVMMYNNNPDIKIILVLGEVGGTQELEIALAVKNNLINKPVIGLCLGKSAEYFNNSNVQFGHAGAFINNDIEKASYKNEFMSLCGIIVPDDFDNITSELTNIYTKIDNLSKKKSDCSQIINKIKNRKKYDMLSSICDERGDELQYNHKNISELNPTIGSAISNLWFKNDLPEYMKKYFEYIVFITADHGPCVSGAQNTIVTTRAGKDLVSSLCSGLLTIGPKFGGAVNQAGIDFYNGYKNNYKPYEFVEFMKNKGQVISGIGHKIKSKDNPDKRVVMLEKFINENYPVDLKLNLTNFAKEVEKITLQKKNNLILNVDGFIAVSILDGLLHHFDKEYVEKLLELDIFNAFFILGRTIGLIGHHIDQKMLGSDLYRMSADRVGYI